MTKLIEITPHAKERFKERYEAINGVQFNDWELMDKLLDLISKAVPEEESPVLEVRREAHDGIGTYLINDPWRFVFSEKRLETCEIIPQDVLSVENPHIPDGEVQNRFLIKIKLDRRKLLTEITKYYDKKTLHLRNLIEIDVIIRILRFLGLEVNQLTEENKLEIVVPRNVGVYWIEQQAKPENLLIFWGRTNSFPLGQKKVNCSGITKPDLKKILNFVLQINKS